MYFIACLQQEFAAISKIRKDLYGIPLLLPFWHRAFSAMYFFLLLFIFLQDFFGSYFFLNIYTTSVPSCSVFLGVLDGWVVSQNALLLSLTRNLN